VTNMLTVRDLHVKRGSTHILRGVDITVAPGEICVLMGASGGGKSTALRAVVALQPFDSGSVTVGDVSLMPGPLPPESRRGRH